MSWHKQSYQTSSGGIFLRLEPGSPVHIVVADEPMRRLSHWTGDTYEECTSLGGGGCDWCDAGVGLNVKYLLNVYATAERKIMILEVTSACFGDVVQELSTVDDPAQYVIRLLKTGAGKKTRYKATIAGRAGDRLGKVIADADRHDLSEFGGHPLSAATTPNAASEGWEPTSGANVDWSGDKVEPLPNDDVPF